MNECHNNNNVENNNENPNGALALYLINNTMVKLFFFHVMRIKHCPPKNGQLFQLTNSFGEYLECVSSLQDTAKCITYTGVVCTMAALMLIYSNLIFLRKFVNFCFSRFRFDFTYFTSFSILNF